MDQLKNYIQTLFILPGFIKFSIHLIEYRLESIVVILAVFKVLSIVQQLQEKKNI